MLAFFFLVRSYIFFDDDIGKQLSLKSKTDESEYTHSLMLRNNYKNKFEIECLCVCVWCFTCLYEHSRLGELGTLRKNF